MQENKTAVFDVRTLLFLDMLIMVFMLISGKPEVTLSSFIVAAAVPVITGLYGALVCYAILFAALFSYYQLIFHLKLPVFHSAFFFRYRNTRFYRAADYSLHAPGDGN